LISKASGSTRNRVGEVVDFVLGAPAEHREVPLQGVRRLAGLPVVVFYCLDPRIDCVRGKAERRPISTPVDNVRT
jgi:hypothetical protein